MVGVIGSGKKKAIIFPSFHPALNDPCPPCHPEASPEFGLILPLDYERIVGRATPEVVSQFLPLVFARSRIDDYGSSIDYELVTQKVGMEMP